MGSSVWAPWLWRMGLFALWRVDLLGSATEPVSPALAGGFFTTEPPGQPGLAISDEIVFKLWLLLGSG